MFSDADDPDDFFKDHSDSPFPSHQHQLPIMEIVITLVCGVGIVVVLLLICRCCCSTRDPGRVVAPPSALPPAPPGPGAYPQQHYTTVAVPTVTVLPVGHSLNTSHPTTVPYPGGGAPYPTGGAHYPMGGAPYPTGGAPYPTGGAPYPTGGAPYPTGGAPYPTGGAGYPTGGAPYPTAMPVPNVHPSASDPHALPPSYEQVMGAGEQKQPPYNPYAH